MSWRNKILLLGRGPRLRYDDLFLIWVLWTTVLGSFILVVVGFWVGMQATVGAIYAASIFVLRFMDRHIDRVAMHLDDVTRHIDELSVMTVRMPRPPALVADFGHNSHLGNFFKGKVYLDETMNALARLRTTIVLNLVSAIFVGLASIGAAVYSRKSSGSIFDLDWTTVLSAISFTISACWIWIPIHTLATRHRAYV